MSILFFAPWKNDDSEIQLRFSTFSSTADYWTSELHWHEYFGYPFIQSYAGEAFDELIEKFELLQESLGMVDKNTALGLFRTQSRAGSILLHLFESFEESSTIKSHLSSANPICLSAKLRRASATIRYRCSTDISGAALTPLRTRSERFRRTNEMTHTEQKTVCYKRQGQFCPHVRVCLTST